jgi:hypothetical protein
LNNYDGNDASLTEVRSGAFKVFHSIKDGHYPHQAQIKMGVNKINGYPTPYLALLYRNSQEAGRDYYMLLTPTSLFIGDQYIGASTWYSRAYYRDKIQENSEPLYPIDEIFDLDET